MISGRLFRSEADETTQPKPIGKPLGLGCVDVSTMLLDIKHEKASLQQKCSLASVFVDLNTIHMKKTSIQTAILIMANLFLLGNLFMACQKETSLLSAGTHENTEQVNPPSIGQLVFASPEDLGFDIVDDRDGVTAHAFDNGSCKLKFIVGNFNPLVPHGGNPYPLCSPSFITLEGYSHPNGWGNLLFSTQLALTQTWQEITIPSSAYIRFKITQDPRNIQTPCLFQFFLADFGWNKSLAPQVNIPYNVWVPMYCGRFAPKDPSVDGFPTVYDKYLCDTWCTWRVPIYFDDPTPEIPWMDNLLFCHYGPNALPYHTYPDDPRRIKQYPLWSTFDTVFYFYPITEEADKAYRTGTADTGPSDDSEVGVWYNIFGQDNQWVGSYTGWNVAPKTIYTRGGSCSVRDE